MSSDATRPDLKKYRDVAKQSSYNCHLNNRVTRGRRLLPDLPRCNQNEKKRRRGQISNGAAQGARKKGQLVTWGRVTTQASHQWPVRIPIV